LAAAQSVDGSRWTYFTPLRWRKRWLQGPTDCCFFSGPRGMARVPTSVYVCKENAVIVNLFESGYVEVEVAGQTVTVQQDTAYPGSGRVRINIATACPVDFLLRIRIPEYTRGHHLVVNGKPVSEPIAAGETADLSRRWEEGDQVELELDLDVATVVLADGSRMIRRGIEVLAADRRDGPELGDEQLSLSGTDLADCPLAANNRRRYRIHATTADRDTELILTPYADAGNGEDDDVPGAIGFRTAFLPRRWN
jgi:DUF1680 family protein